MGFLLLDEQERAFSGSHGRPNLFFLFWYGEGISKRMHQKTKRPRKYESSEAVGDKQVSHCVSFRRTGRTREAFATFLAICPMLSWALYSKSGA